MRSALPTLLLLLAAAAPAATIQRRAPDEAAAARNAVGELTYSVEGGAAVLRVGTSDAGTLVASDPWALHVAPRRLLGPREYSLHLSAGAAMLPDGRVCLASNVTEAVGSVTESVTLRVADPAVRIASVRWRLDQDGARQERENTETEATLTATTVYRELMGRPIIGYCYVVGVEVWAWASDRRDETWDTSVADLPFRDSLGETSVGSLRKWVAARYDGRTAEDWSNHPATNAVRLAGQTLWHSSTIRSVVSDGDLSLVVAGAPVLSFTGPEDAGRTNALRIAHIEVSDDTATLWATAALGAPVRVQSCGDLAALDWRDVDGVVSSYPATETPPPTAAEAMRNVQCYRLEVPVDPAADACFYRVCSTIGPAEQRTVRVEPGAALYIDGVRAAWTNIVVNGATLRVLAAQPD